MHTYTVWCWASKFHHTSHHRKRNILGVQHTLHTPIVQGSRKASYNHSFSAVTKFGIITHQDREYFRYWSLPDSRVLVGGFCYHKRLLHSVHRLLVKTQIKKISNENPKWFHASRQHQQTKTMSLRTQCTDQPEHQALRLAPRPSLHTSTPSHSSDNLKYSNTQI